MGIQVPGSSRHVQNTWLTYKIDKGTLTGLGISLGYQYQAKRSPWYVFDGTANSLPDYFRLGVTIGKPSEWLAGADFSYQNWENFKNFEANDTLKNSYTLNVGGERRTKKLIYRLGGRYTKTYLNLNETQLDDYGVTVGIGIQKLLPKRPPSAINIAIEVGQRGTLENNLLKEQYVRFHLGFTLTDSWFNRSKYD